VSGGAQGTSQFGSTSHFLLKGTCRSMAVRRRIREHWGAWRGPSVQHCRHICMWASKSHPQAHHTPSTKAHSAGTHSAGMHSRCMQREHGKRNRAQRKHVQQGHEQQVHATRAWDEQARTSMHSASTKHGPANPRDVDNVDERNPHYPRDVDDVDEQSAHDLDECCTGTRPARRRAARTRTARARAAGTRSRHTQHEHGGRKRAQREHA
jgi:hypothetical protein